MLYDKQHTRMLEHENQQPDSTAQTIRQAVRFLRVLWHRRIIVMGTLALCGMLGGLYYATATRIYEAKAQLLVVDTSRESSPTSMTGSHSDIAAMATYAKLVSSPSYYSPLQHCLIRQSVTFSKPKIPKYLVESSLKDFMLVVSDRLTYLNLAIGHHTKKHLPPLFQPSFKPMQASWMSHTAVLRTR